VGDDIEIAGEPHTPRDSAIERNNKTATAGFNIPPRSSPLHQPLRASYQNPHHRTHPVHLRRAPPMRRPGLRMRSRPSAVRGPVLAPPCILHFPQAIAGALQAMPVLVWAPHRGEA
jgi:hypothetical protein